MKLAARMLRKSPGAAIGGVLGIAVGIAAGIASFVLPSNIFVPDLPLDGGERIVALENRDVVANDAARRSLHDVLTWREEIGSAEQIAAASMSVRSLVTGDAPPRPVRAAETTAAGFHQVARVPPLAGRYPVEEDEREGAPSVAVLGYDLRRTRFDGDPRVLGRWVLVGDAEHSWAPSSAGRSSSAPGSPEARRRSFWARWSS